jgi:membrane protein required for colicin V production
MADIEFTSHLTWIDWVLLVVLASSTLLAVLRGFVQEITGVVIWSVALIAAYQLYDFPAQALTGLVTEPIPQVLGFVLIVLLVLLIGKLVRLALKELVTASGGAAIDRFLGGLFGVARGLAISVALAVLISLTPLPADRAWQKAWFRPMLEYSLSIANPWLPEFLTVRMHYSGASPPLGVIAPLSPDSPRPPGPLGQQT